MSDNGKTIKLFEVSVINNEYYIEFHSKFLPALIAGQYYLRLQIDNMVIGAQAGARQKDKPIISVPKNILNKIRGINNG